MAEVKYHKSEYNETYHSSLRSLLLEIKKDLRNETRFKSFSSDKAERVYSANKRAIMYTIESIMEIEDLLEKIYKTPSRLQIYYSKELRLLNDERKRLLDLLYTEVLGFKSYKNWSGLKSAVGNARHTFAKYESYFANLDKQSADKSIAEKEKSIERDSSKYKEDLDSLHSLIEELDSLVASADKANPIKEEVRKEVTAIKRVYQPRVISTSKEIVDRLEHLEERELVLDYLEMLYVPFSRVDRSQVRDFKKSIRGAFFDDRRVYLQNVKTSKVLRKIEKSLKRTYDRLSKEMKKNQKEQEDLKYKKSVIRHSLNKSTSAVHNYKFSLLKNEEDIEARKKAEELYPSKEYKELDDSVIKANIRLQTLDRNSKEAQELRKYIEETEKELDRLDAQKEADKKRVPSITSLNPNYTNMEEKLEDVKRL